MTLDDMINKACDELNVIVNGDVFGQVFDDEQEYTYEQVKSEVYSAAQIYDLWF